MTSVLFINFRDVTKYHIAVQDTQLYSYNCLFLNY